ETAPNIDRIARDGVLFKDFFNAGCPTGPGFTCIYTGLHTIHHKFYRFGDPNLRQVDDTIFTIPEIMRAMGYTTAGFDNLMNLLYARAKHFVRGYEFYVNCGPSAFDLAHHLKAEQLNHRLIPWLKQYANEKFFLFVHYWDPHGPYNQPEPFRTLFQHKKGSLDDLLVKEAPAGYKYVPGWGTVDQVLENDKKTIIQYGEPATVDLYDGEIAYMDKAIGEVIDTLENQGVLEDTAVIVTSDHGEQLSQHGLWQHGFLHAAETHIPLIIRYPKRLPKGVRVKGFCQQIDILPTIMDLVGVSPKIVDVDGTSVLPLLRGERIRDQIFMETSNGQRALRTEEWMFIEDEIVDMEARAIHLKMPKRKPELYNVKNDPMEVINLVDKEKERAEQMRETLISWVKSNIKEGENDPAIYEDWRELNKRTLDYGAKVKKLLESLKASFRPTSGPYV
ncbi:MAG: sulfatase, partial [Nitrososphaerota archaeon]